MSKQSVIRLSFCLVFCLTVMWFSSAEAAICGREVSTTYYAWIDNSNPNLYWCQPPLIGPYIPIETYAHWSPIGGTDRDCEGYTSSWGDTTSCTGTANKVTHSSACFCEINP